MVTWVFCAVAHNAAERMRIANIPTNQACSGLVCELIVPSPSSRGRAASTHDDTGGKPFVLRVGENEGRERPRTGRVSSRRENWPDTPPWSSSGGNRRPPEPCAPRVCHDGVGTSLARRGVPIASPCVKTTTVAAASRPGCDPLCE